MDVFGFSINRKKALQVQQSVVAPSPDDGSTVINSSASYYGLTLDLEGIVKTDIDLIRRYRESSQHPDCDAAIEDIVNEAIVDDPNTKQVTIILDDLPLDDKIKDIFRQQFDKVLRLYRFEDKGHDIFRQWYIDGRISYQVIVDPEQPELGIQELRYIDPRKIRKIKHVTKERDQMSGAEVTVGVEEYYLYNDSGFNLNTTQGVKLPVDSVIHVTSGRVDTNNSLVLSHLHKAIKPTNQLKMMEDALVIYRISRAPERRIFYIDVGNLPKGRAEQYVTDIMNKFRNKITYDVSTGEVKDSKQHLSMMEDFWMPRRDCLALSTRIKLLDGRAPELGELINEFKEGKENWVYSVSPEGKIVAGVISWAGITRLDTEVVDVTLDNGEVITTTPDHKFILRTGVKIEAKDLQVGASLMPLNLETSVGVVSITKREDRIDTGTLTIDGNHLYHDYHNFALSSGVFVMNSGKGTEITTLPGACLAMTTKVSLLDGRDLSIREIAAEMTTGKTLWAYSCDEYTGEIKPGLISWAGVTNASANVMKLTLDNGEEIVCTPDHKFPVYGKGFVEARNFEVGQSLIPLYRKTGTIGKNRYEQVFDNADKKWVYTHRMVKSNMTLPTYIYEENSGHVVVHHINHIKSDNTPSNLCLMGWKDHGRYHQSIKFPAGVGTAASVARMTSERNANTDWYVIMRCVTDSVKGMTTHQVTVQDVTARLNMDEDCLSRLREINKDKRVPNWSPDVGFTPNMVKKIPLQFGYGGWTDFRRKESLHNHRIVSIEHLADPIEVGTLTIDKDETVHGHHTFSLACGVFTKNSNLSQIDDIIYFQKRLFQSLNVPLGRLMPEQGFSLGHSDTISREEIKFNKFIGRLRKKFSKIFREALRVQLIALNIIRPEEWEQINEFIRFDYQKDNYFSEQKATEIMNGRLAILQVADQYVGKYFSYNWVRKNVLQQSEDEINEMQKEIEYDMQAQLVYAEHQGEVDLARQEPALMAQQGQQTKKGAK